MADRTVTYRFTGDIKGLQASMAAAGQSVGKFSNDLNALDRNGAKMRANLSTIGGAAGKMGLVAAAGIGLAAKAAIDWESAWAGVSKTVDGSASEMAKLEGELRGLAKVLPASHAEIAAVAEAAGQLGVQRDGIAAFTRTMIDLGETTNLSADEAATSIAQMANVMGTAPDEIERVGSALVALGNAGASTEREILGMAQRIAGAGAQIGLVESDILAIANAAASMGVEVEAGGTAITRVFTDMAKATAQGNEKLETFAEVAGMTSAEFTDAFENDPARAFASFTEGLDGINKSGGDVFGTLDKLKLSDVRVSQALLGMAASGDLLTDSLDLGAKAWDENTALAEEAAKRYQTTSAQMQIAWNNVTDAGIEFGAAVLPVLAKGAEGLAKFASALGGLPGPIKGALTGLAGITAILGGGLWFTSKVVNGVASTKDALSGLGVSADKTSRGMRGLAKAGLALAALTAAAAGIRAIQAATDESLPGLEELTGRLLDLKDGQVGDLGSEFDSLGESIDRLTDKGASEKFADAMQTPFEGLFGEASSLRQAKAEIDSLDQALAALVSSGHADEAADALAALGLDDSQMDRLLSTMPQYEDALAGIANDAKLAGEGEDQFAGGLETATSALDVQTASLEKNIEAMRDKRNAAIEAANAEIGYQASIDAARKALKDNGKTLDITTNKGRANRQALLDQAAAWNGQSDAVKNSKGAHREAINTFVDMAVRMGMNEDKARDYAKSLFEIPSKVMTKVDLDASAALGTMSQVDRWLELLDGKRATTYIDTIRSGARSVPGLQMATGGEVAGPGTATSDSIPALLSNGEHVWTAREVKAAGGHAAMEAMRSQFRNARRYADGGAAGSAFSSMSIGSPNVSVGGPSVRVFIDGSEVRAVVRSEIADDKRHERRQSTRV